ncbi:perlucin-like [Mya arenaria]|uniref:perlucin-like n=1 Tax=Mya arenaria TaxID=6604 RepID=UPI0022E363ED|nr:perlucin-like [Mya arenaria]
MWTSIIVSATLVAQVFCACTDGWTSHGSSCYKFATDIETWSSARLFCKWHSSDLIVIETESEQRWFHKQALTFNHTDVDEGFWLGGTNWEQDAHWIWESTGAELTYQTWGAQQPNNQNGTEHCLSAVKYFDYVWNDAPCDRKIQYVCEKSSTSGGGILG